jgi:hypothetical protein
MVEHLMSFKGNEIQVNQHIRDPKSIVSDDETVLHEEEAVWIGLLIATQALNSNKITNLVPLEYH